MKTWSLNIIISVVVLCGNLTISNGQSYDNGYGQILTVFCYQPAQVQKTTGKMKIYHDPDADFKQRRGQIHNRTYLKKKLAPLHLNIDSLQDVVDYLNRDTRAKEWEYQISTMPGSAGKILPIYKSHNNADGTSGRTIYGDERRRQPDR